MSKNKIALAGIASAVVGFFLQGCFAAQPPPECSVITGNALFGLSNYYAMLEKKGQTGTCTDAPSGDMKFVEVAMTRYSIPGQKQNTVAIRNSYFVLVQQGLVYVGNEDGTNDCSRPTSPGKCNYCIADGTGATAVFVDGGAAAAFLEDGGLDVATLADGGMGPPRGIIYPAGDGGTRISLTNACGETEEQIARVDADDPDGKKIDTIANIPSAPDKNGVCTLSDFKDGVQNLQEVPLVSGSLPAIKLASEWSNFALVNNTKAPGTFWTADLKMTEGSCVTDYAATAFWPMLTCAVLDENGAVSVDANMVPLADEAACDPYADVDGGPRITGSGISPNFKPKCRTDVLDWAGRPVCVPTVTAADLIKK